MSSLTPRINNIESLDNKIINGNLDFWQRSTSAAISTGEVFVADRFKGATEPSGHTITFSRSTDVPTTGGAVSTYSLLCTNGTGAALAAGTLVRVRYRIEGYDIVSLMNDNITASFWVKSSVAGVYSLSFVNNGGTRSYIAAYTINFANTWEYKTITIDLPNVGVWDFTTSTGLNLNWNITAGTTYHTANVNQWLTSGGNQAHPSNGVTTWATTTGSTFQIAQVSLTSGSSAGSFKRAGKTIGDELRMCQRYYEKSYNVDVNPGTNTGIGSSTATDAAYAATQFYGVTFPYQVQKRAAPTVTFFTPSGTSGSWIVAGNNAGTRVMSNGSNGTSSLFAQCNGAGMTANVYSNINGHWTADSEL